jgi:uncharacterized protein (DUF58 family)
MVETPLPPDEVRSGSRRADAVAGALDVAGHRAVDIGRWTSRRVLPVLRVVTPLGWTVLGLGFGSWILGSWFGWIEVMVIAAGCLFLFVFCSLLTFGRTSLRVRVDVDPDRVVVGEPAAGRVEVTNISKVRLVPIELDLPVGESAARFSLPTIAPSESHEEIFVVPTTRRAVIPVGPAMTVRGDPFGLLRRNVEWTDVSLLFVHPRTVPLESLGAGLLRDLEGQSSTDISMSDLAFHALRDYVPGDDRRHIHWKSSAKIGSTIPGGKFMVRQFLDTRRSHLTVVVDGQPGFYREPDDFETAVSAAASVVLRAIRDDIETTVVVAEQVSHEADAQRTMDSFSMAEFDTGDSFSTLAGRGAIVAPDTSIALLITGANSTFTDLQRAATHYPPEVKVTALVVDPTRPVGISGTSTLSVMNLPHLGDLPSLLRGSGL